MIIKEIALPTVLAMNISEYSDYYLPLSLER